MDPMRPTPSLLCKIASLLVHVEEANGPDGHPFDVAAIDALKADPEYREWMAGMGGLGLIPVKRREPSKKGGFRV